MKGRNRLPTLGLLLLALGACQPETGPRPPGLDSLPPLPERAAEVDLPRGEVREPRELSIVLVGEVRGEIEPCGCPTLPYGGFARRSVMLDRLRAEELPLFHLDAGELLLKGTTTSRAASRDRRARLLLELSQQVGVDAWTPGPSDLLAIGVEDLLAVRDGRLPGPPPVSATWEDSQGRLLLPASRVIERGGLRLGVIGVSPEPQGQKGAIRMREPVEAVKEALEALPPDLDLVVAMGPLSDLQADALARELPALGLVLSTRGATVDPPRTPEGPEGPGAMIVETPDRGRYLQRLSIRLGSSRETPLLLHPEDTRWRELLNTREQLRNTRARSNPRAAEVEQALARLEAGFEEIGRGRNLIRVEAIPLGEDLDPPESPGPARPERDTLARQIARFKEESMAMAARTAAEPPPVESHGYASAGACVNCHAQEFARWSYTDHAKAWLPMVERKVTDNPECISCHTTAFGEPGGLGELTDASLRQWKAVQCESCHGPMGGHPDDRRVRSLPVTAERCTGCHDPANSPGFDFASYLPRASCQPHERAISEGAGPGSPAGP